MANENIGSKRNESTEAKTARLALNTNTISAIVTLFLLRDGTVLPNEFKHSDVLDSVGKDAERQLLLYAELSGLLKAEAAQAAHSRVEEAD